MSAKIGKKKNKKVRKVKIPYAGEAYGMSKEGLNNEKLQYVVDLVEMVDNADF